MKFADFAGGHFGNDVIQIVHPILVMVASIFHGERGPMNKIKQVPYCPGGGARGVYRAHGLLYLPYRSYNIRFIFAKTKRLIFRIPKNEKHSKHSIEAFKFYLLRLRSFQPNFLQGRVGKSRSIYLCISLFYLFELYFMLTTYYNKLSDIMYK